MQLEQLVKGTPQDPEGESDDVCNASPWRRSVFAPRPFPKFVFLLAHSKDIKKQGVKGVDHFHK